jgi:hypothetical protein
MEGLQREGGWQADGGGRVSVNSFLNPQFSVSVSIGSGPLDIELRTKQHYSSLEVDSGFYGDSSLQSASSIGSVGYSSGGLGTCASSPDSRRSTVNFIYVIFTTKLIVWHIYRFFVCGNVNQQYIRLQLDGL